MPSDAEHPFMCLWAQYVLLGEISVQDLCPLFNWMFVFLVLSWMSSLYILEIKPLSEVLLANMFSHTVGSLFILMMFSLEKFSFRQVQKIFNLNHQRDANQNRSEIPPHTVRMATINNQQTLSAGEVVEKTEP